MKIICGYPHGCLSTIESPSALSSRHLQQLLYTLHWVRRGSVTGTAYYCPNHNPDNKETQVRRERSKSTAAQSACGSDCTKKPLFNLLGHDETGHRTARLVMAYVMRLEDEQGVRVYGWDTSEEYQRSDRPLELLLEMTGAELRKINGIGARSFERLEEVLGALDEDQR